MDPSQETTFALLIVTGITAVILWLKQWWPLYKIRATGKVAVMDWKDALAVVLVIPIGLTGFIGALWIYRKGWEDFSRTISICLSYGLIGGIIFATFFYAVNRISLRMLKKTT